MLRCRSTFRCSFPIQAVIRSVTCAAQSLQNSDMVFHDCYISRFELLHVLILASCSLFYLPHVASSLSRSQVGHKRQKSSLRLRPVPVPERTTCRRPLPVFPCMPCLPSSSTHLAMQQNTAFHAKKITCSNLLNHSPLTLHRRRDFAAGAGAS